MLHQVVQLLDARLLHGGNLRLDQALVRSLQRGLALRHLVLRGGGVCQQTLGIRHGELERLPARLGVVRGLELLARVLVVELLQRVLLDLALLLVLGAVETNLTHRAVLVDGLPAGVQHLHHDIAGLGRAKAHLLPLVAVLQRDAVVVELEGAHDDAVAALQRLHGVAHDDLRLEDVSVGTAVLARQEGDVGEVVVLTEVEDHVLGQGRSVVAAVPDRGLVVVEHALDRALARLAGLIGNRHAGIGLGVDEGLLIDLPHLEALDGLLDGRGGIRDLGLGVLAGQQLVGCGDGVGQLGIALGRVGVLAVARGLGERRLQRGRVHALLDLELVAGGLGGIELGRHRDGGLAGLVAADVVLHVVAVLHRRDARHGRVGTLHRKVGVGVAVSGDGGLDRRKVIYVDGRLVLTQLDGLHLGRRLDVVEVDLAQGEHTVVGSLRIGRRAGGGQRRNVDARDLLGLVRFRDGEGVNVLLGVVLAARELLHGAILEGDARLDALHHAVAGRAGEHLHVAHHARHLHGEVQRGGELHVARQLAVHLIGRDIPLELELTPLLVAVEQRGVAARLLDELRDVGAVVAHELVVRHGDVERLLTVLGLGVAGYLGERHGAVVHGLLEVLLGADDPGCGGDARGGRLCLGGDARRGGVGLGAQLEARHHAGAAVELLVASVQEGQVHALDAIREAALRHGEVLHLGDGAVLGDAAGHELELGAVVVHECAEGVGVLHVVRKHVDADDVARLGVGGAGHDDHVAIDFAGLLGAAVQRAHGKGHVVSVEGAVEVVVGAVLGHMGVELVDHGLAVLAAQAVALEVLVGRIGHRRTAVDSADLGAGGAVDLVKRHLGRGEEAARGLLDREAQVTRRGAGEVHSLGGELVRTGVIPGVGLVLLPVHAVHAGLELHLAHVAVATVVLARHVDELVELVGLAVVDGHRLAHGVAVGGVEHLVVDLVVESVLHGAPAIALRPGDVLGLGGVSPRVLQRGRSEDVAPLGVTVLAAGTHLIGVRAVIGEVRMGVGVHVPHGENGAVHLELVPRGALDLVPGELDARGSLGLLGCGQARRHSEVLVQADRGQVAVVLKALHGEGLGALGHVRLGEFHVQLGRRGDLGLGELLVAHRLAVGSGVVVEVGGLVVEVHGLARLGLGGLQGLLAVHLGELELGVTVLGHEALGLGGGIHHEGRGALGLVARVAALGLLGREGGRVAVHLGGVGGGHVAAVGDVVLGAVRLIGGVRLVLDVGTRVLVLGVATLARRGEELHVALGAVRLVWVVVGLVHRNDGVGLHEHRKLPDGCVEVVEHLAAAVLLARPVIHPDVVFGAGQVDVVADVVAVAQAAVGGVAVGVLVDGRHQDVLAQRVLVLRGRARRVRGVIGQQDGAHDGQARVAVAGVDVRRARRRCVDVGHERALELEVHAVDARVRVAVAVGHLGVGAPAVHVQHQRGEGLPLVVAGGDDGVTAPDAVHVGADVGVAREALADERGHVEADVLPIAARLVAGPHAGETLAARPAVQGDDVGTDTGVAVPRGDDIVGGLGAVEAEGVARAHPGHVGLEGGDAAGLHLSGEVAQRMPGSGGV